MQAACQSGKCRKLLCNAGLVQADQESCHVPCRAGASAPDPPARTGAQCDCGFGARLTAASVPLPRRAAAKALAARQGAGGRARLA